ncbi:MAG TPA: hypothetical protein VF573_15365 [Paraburkholderia sp.]
MFEHSEFCDEEIVRRTRMGQHAIAMESRLADLLGDAQDREFVDGSGKEIVSVGIELVLHGGFRWRVCAATESARGRAARARSARLDPCRERDRVRQAGGLRTPARPMCNWMAANYPYRIRDLLVQRGATARDSTALRRRMIGLRRARRFRQFTDRGRRMRHIGLVIVCVQLLGYGIGFRLGCGVTGRASTSIRRSARMRERTRSDDTDDQAAESGDECNDSGIHLRLSRC